jgi:hypothetical protein
MLQGEYEKDKIRQYLSKEISGYTDEQFKHALQFMVEGGVVTPTDNMLNFSCEIDQEFIGYVDDLLEYGLSQYSVKYTTDEEDFLLYQDYRQDHQSPALCLLFFALFLLAFFSLLIIVSLEIAIITVLCFFLLAHC